MERYVNPNILALLGQFYSKIVGNYTRKPKTSDYDKTTRQYYDVTISNKYLQFVLEIDYNSFGCSTIAINKDNRFADPLVRACRCLLQMRKTFNIHKSTNSNLSRKEK